MEVIMAAFNWSDKYSVNVAEMDAQHKKLVGLLNELDEAMSQGKGRTIVGRILSGLFDYAATHFRDEESLMERHGFADIEAHKALHSKLTAQATSLNDDFQEGSISVTIETMNFLTNWLTDHILGTDSRYGAYLNGKGIY